MKTFFISLFLLGTISGAAQNILKARLIDEETKEPLIGASAQVKGTSIGASADENGMLEIQNIPVNG